MSYIFSSHVFVKNAINFIKQRCSTCRFHSNANMNEVELLQRSKELIPALAFDKQKGQAGRIGVIGGSLEYTGAPYFAAISALKIGADLVHVFCVKDAAVVIKSYSPDLIVHPILDSPNITKEIEPWLDNLNAVVLGPGLGRQDLVIANTSIIMDRLKAKNKPLVIDADGLFLITQQPQLIKDYPNVILTPNVVEYERLMKIVQNKSSESLLFLNDNATIVRKGPTDEIFNKKMKIKCSTVGSKRRCGGQGDILSGALAIFYAWSMNFECTNEERDIKTLVACFGACHLVRKTSFNTFQAFGRSMVANDMVHTLGKTFKELYEH